MANDRLLERVKAFIDPLIPDDAAFSVNELAAMVRTAMSFHNPELLSEWEAELSRNQLAKYLGDHLRRERRFVQIQMRRQRSVSRINEAVRSGQLRPFLSKVCVDGKQWKPIGLVTRRDCWYVSDMYQKRGEQQLLEARFWAQIAKRIGTGTLSDVMPEEKFARLYRSVTGKPFSAAA